MFFQEGDKIVPLEICLLRKISDIDGVIRLLDFYEMPETFVLILERPPRSKDLFDFINDHGFLDESLSRDFLRQVVDTILGKENLLHIQKYKNCGHNSWYKDIKLLNSPSFAYC